MTFEKVVVIDCKNHLLGRLASIIAKELLQGQRVVCVRTEDINISGSHYRNKLKFLDKMRKCTNTNPAHGPFHFRSPSKVFYRVIRGMIPHKTHRGKCAMERLKCFEGVPAPYDKMKRMVVPDAFRVTRLKVGRRYCRLGRLSSELGWNMSSIVERLEAKRKAEGAVYADAKKAELAKAKAKAAAIPGDAILAKFGY